MVLEYGEYLIFIVMKQLNQILLFLKIHFA